MQTGGKALLCRWAGKVAWCCVSPSPIDDDCTQCLGQTSSRGTQHAHVSEITCRSKGECLEKSNECIVITTAVAIDGEDDDIVADSVQIETMLC